MIRITIEGGNTWFHITAETDDDYNHSEIVTADELQATMNRLVALVHQRRAARLEAAQD